MSRLQFNTLDRPDGGPGTPRPAPEVGSPTEAKSEDDSPSGSEVGCLVFDNVGRVAREASWPPGPEYILRIVRARLTAPLPPGLPTWPFLGFWLLHVLHLFRSRDHAVFVVLRDAIPVHYTTVVPKYFRFPFMGASDLLLGSTWTDPRHRGRSIASSVVAEILRAYPGRRFWYLTRAANLASRKVALAAGLRPSGRAQRSKRFGSSLLGAYRLSAENGK